jgi:spermidine synthase
MTTSPGSDESRPTFVDRFTPGETIEYAIERTIARCDTAFQRLAILDLVGHGRTLILDDNIQSAERDEHLYHEALVLPAALLATRSPRNALVLGGGEGATLREVLRVRSIERAIMVDLDREVVAACRQHLPTFHRGAFDDPRVELHFEDAAAFLERTGETFDLIVEDVVDPSEEPAAHLYSREFFAAVQRRLAPGGAFALQIGPAFEQHSDAGAAALGALGRVFDEVLAGRVFVPVYLAPWGMAVAGRDLASAADETLIAERIASRLLTPPSSFDAQDVAAMLTLPLPLRRMS